MRTPVYAVFTCVLILAAGCKKKDAATASAAQPATVILRDGTRLNGDVTASSASQITLRAADGTSRILDMRNVRTVDYGPDTSQQANAEQPNPAPPPPGQTVNPRDDDGMPTPPRYHPDESHISSSSMLLPVGTRVQVRTDETINSESAVDGQTYAAEIYRDVSDASGSVVLPQGANARLAIRSASRGGQISHASDLLIDLADVSVGGRRYRVISSDTERKGKDGVGGNKRTAKYVGGASALGAVIGAIAGHGKGALIGAGAGAGAGAVAEIATKGESVRIPAETILTFRLEQPLRIEAAR